MTLIEMKLLFQISNSSHLESVLGDFISLGPKYLAKGTYTGEGA